MQIEQARESADRIEQCADAAVQAVQQGGGASAELRDIVAQMHQQARQLRDLARQSSEPRQLTRAVDSLEQLGDDAKQAFLRAAGEPDTPLRSAVMQAHEAISNLKQQLH